MNNSKWLPMNGPETDTLKKCFDSLAEAAWRPGCVQNNFVIKFA